MLLGWLSVAIFVRPALGVQHRLSTRTHDRRQHTCMRIGAPGMSTSVRLGTAGERMVSMMGSGETALPVPSERFVSASISSRTASAVWSRRGACVSRRRDGSRRGVQSAQEGARFAVAA